MDGLAIAVLLLYFFQVLPRPIVHLRCLRELFAGDTTVVARVRHDEAAIDRHLLALHQTRRDALLYDALKQLLKQIRFLKAAMPILRERRVMGNLLLKP